jgi:broad specificity phosphatase PhoE
MKYIPKNIITIQHTESEHHTNGMIGSWTDWPLSANGILQAGRIGERLATELGAEKYVVYSSTLQRAAQTAAILAGCLSVEVRYTESLKERNLGAAVGKSVQWLKENIECEEYTIDDKCFRDAESRRDVWLRLWPFYQQLMQREEQNVILVSHGDTLSIFNAMWLGLEPEFLNTADLYGATGGVSFLCQNSQGKRIIRRLSDMSYVGFTEKG